MRLLTTLLAVLCFTTLAVAADKPTTVKPVPFDSGRQEAVLTPEEVIHLGSGFVTHAALSGNLLAVSVARTTPARGDRPTAELPMAGALPRTSWYGVNTVDVYQFQPDGTATLLTTLPQQYPVKTLALNPTRLYVTDSVGVASYGINAKTGELGLLWKSALPDVQQIAGLGSFLLFQTAENTQVMQDIGYSCTLRGDTPAFLKRFATAGVPERMFVLSRTGDCSLYALPPSGSFTPFRDLPLLGNVLSIANYGPQLLVLDRDFGLRLMISSELTKIPPRNRPLNMPQSFDDPRFQTAEYKSKFVLSELPLEKGQVECHVFGALAYLMDEQGKLSAIPIDPLTHQLGAMSAVDGVGAVAEIAGDANEQVVLGRDGTVTRLREGKVFAHLLSGIEAGPWFEADGKLYVARGPAVHAIDKGTWGAELLREPATIVDIRTDGPRVWLLSEKQLTVGEVKDGNFNALGTVETPADSVFLRLGPEYVAIVHGDRGLAMVDIRDPQKLSIVSDRQLEMPTHSEPVSKTGEDKGFERKISDVLVEANRVFVIGTEVFLYDLAQLTQAKSAATWKAMWHRPYVSADDLLYTSRIAPLGGDRYLVNAYRHESFPYARSYVISMRGDEFADWRYCRLGIASALDMKSGPDGLLFAAAGFDGLRLVNLGEPDTYLGSEYVLSDECQAVLVQGDQITTRSGNTLRRYRYALKPTQEATAFTYEAKGDAAPHLTIDGLDVTSAEYQQKMGYRNPLKPVKTDLSDAAGFPATVVPQGTLAFDPKLGRIKFADGRNTEPKFLSRSEHINVCLAGWRKVGKYFVAALSEQSEGFAVMDLSDPTCMKVISLAGQPNGFTYPHTVIAERDGFAYITGNIMNCLLPVDMRDPLHPKYQRMINLQNGGVAKFACVTHYGGFFRGDRLFVPGGAGITEIDVSDPTNVQRIAVHPKGAGIHQVLDKEQRAVRWAAGKLEYLDIADPINPVVLGTYTHDNPNPLSPVTTVTAEGSTYVLAPTGRDTKAVFRIDVSDMQHPRFVEKVDVPFDAKSLWPENGYVYLTGNRTFYVVDWQEPASPRIAAKLDEPNFLGTWKYSYLDKEPRTTEVAGGGFGVDMQIEIKDGNTVWMSAMGASYAVDVSDPTQPKVVGSGPGFGEVWWTCSDNSDIVSIGSYRRSFINISDPLNPKCLMEYYFGHPQEIGTPAKGNHNYQVATDGIWKWHRDEKAGKFHPEPKVKLPLWLGPDTQEMVNGRPACLITGGTGRATKIQSEPIAVKPGETLVLQGQARTVPGTDFPYVSPSYNWPHGTATVSLIREDGKAIANVAMQQDDGIWHSFARGLAVPAGVEKVSVQITVRGSAWLDGLQLMRAGEQVLANPDLDQPLTDEGQHPHWSVVVAGGNKHNSSAADDEILCVRMGSDLFLYDLQEKGVFPVGRIPAGIHPDRDGPLEILVRREGARKVAYVFTYLGLVTIDVTDPRRPIRLGTLSMPFLKPATLAMALGPDCLAMVPSYVSNALTEGFYLVDISNPAQPRLRGSAPARDHSGAVIHNGYLYLGDYSQGMQIWDIRDLDHPKMITNMGFVRCAQTWSLDFHGNHVLRGEVGGLELWETPVLPQSPRGKLTLE